MPAVGGSLESITIAGRSFAVTTDADVGRKLGGYEKQVLANGDGTSRTIMTRVPWALTGVVVEIDDTLEDAEFLQDLQDSTDLEAVTGTYANGVTYQGQGTIVGEVVFNNQSATASLDLGGSGKLTQQ